MTHLPFLDPELLYDHLKCQSCLNFAICPVYSCENTHIVCGLCWGEAKEGDKCKLCKETVTSNGMLDKLLSSAWVKTPCRNARTGCSLKVIPGNMIEHLRGCEFTGIRCLEMKLCDEIPFAPVGLFQHWIEFHGIKMKKTKIYHNQCRVFISQKSFERIGIPGRSVSYFNYNGGTFFVHIVRESDLIYWWVTSLEGDARYIFDCVRWSISHKDDITKIKWKEFPIHGLQCYCLEKIKESGHVCSILNQTLVKFKTEEPDGIYRFCIRVKNLVEAKNMS